MKENMNITVVDTVELTNDHIERLKRLGDLKIYTDIPAVDELENRLKDCDIAILGWSKLDDAILKRAERLQMLSLWSTGVDYVDIAAAKEQGVVVTNVPGYAADTIAEFVLGSFVALARKFLLANDYVRTGGDSWKGFEGTQLKGKVLGIVGLGAIGGATAKLGKCFGMNVIALTSNPSEERAKDSGVTFVSKDELLKKSDFISLHCSLNEDTKGLLGIDDVKKMRDRVFLANTSRAEVLDEHALVEGLASGKIAGAAIDVIDSKPLADNSPLLGFDNLLLTPHCAFFTSEAIVTKTNICIENVENFVSGKISNQVN